MLIREYPCDSKDQLGNIEGVFGRTIKECREVNKDYNKQYYDQNEEEILEHGHIKFRRCGRKI